MTFAQYASAASTTPRADPRPARRDRLNRALRALRRVRDGLDAGADPPDLDEIALLTGVARPVGAAPRDALDAMIAAAEAERDAITRQLRAARAIDALREAPPAPTPAARFGASPMLDEVARLGRIQPDQLDGLPYGAIVLDATGRVLAYNDTESRMARLPAEAVLGRNFFTEVAPCTQVREFEGRFRTLAAGLGPQAVTFDFTFPFQFGPQGVSVLLTRGAAPGTVVLALWRR